jgi:hypothetical protein
MCPLEKSVKEVWAREIDLCTVQRQSGSVICLHLRLVLEVSYNTVQGNELEVIEGMARRQLWCSDGGGAWLQGDGCGAMRWGALDVANAPSSFPSTWNVRACTTGQRCMWVGHLHLLLHTLHTLCLHHLFALQCLHMVALFSIFTTPTLHILWVLNCSGQIHPIQQFFTQLNNISSIWTICHPFGWILSQYLWKIHYCYGLS